MDDLQQLRELFDAKKFAEVVQLAHESGSWSSAAVRVTALSYAARREYGKAYFALCSIPTQSDDFAPDSNNLGAALLAIGRPRAALRHFQHATRADPTYLQGWLNSAKAHIEIRDLHAAAETLAKTPFLPPEAVALVSVITRGLSCNGSGEAAHNLYGVLCARFPDSAPLLLDNIDFLEGTHDLKTASDRIHEFEERFGVTLATNVLRARIALRQDRPTDALAALRELHSPHSDDTEANREEACHLKAQALDAIGRFDEAFGWFRAANGIGRTANGGSTENNLVRVKIASLKQRFEKADVAEAANGAEGAPAFLIGFPRSGTTLLEMVLRSSTQISVLSEQPFMTNLIQRNFPSAEFLSNGDADLAARRLREQYLAAVDKYLGPERNHLLLDKLPLSLIDTPYILRAFPGAKFIFAVRHPLDAVLSCFMQRFRPNEAMDNFRTVPDAAAFYDDVMSLWALYECKLRPDVLFIRYEDLVTDFETQTARLWNFLNIRQNSRSYATEIAQKTGWIRTPSYRQVIKPLYAAACGRWKNYRHYLQTEEQQLSKWVKRFGYESG